MLYIDPNLGALLIQMLVGAVAAVGAAFFMFRQKIASFFGRSKKEDPLEENNTDEETEPEKEQEQKQD